jgi:O-antigen/teichoic acid export membrane protein
MYSASNIIITQLYGPSEVTPYNVAFRLFSSVQVVFSIIVTPFWSAFTEANATQDFSWIKRSINRLIHVWALFSIAVIGLWLISPFVFKMWVGSEVIIPYSLSLQFAIFVIINSWISIFSFFVAGIGKISLSLYGAIFQSIVYIPLAVFLAKSLELNTTGVILSTNINLLIPAIFLVVQTKRIINKKAYGIWNS